MQSISIERVDGGEIEKIAVGVVEANAAFPHDPRWIMAIRDVLLPGQLDVFALRDDNTTVGFLPLVRGVARSAGLTFRLLETPVDNPLDLTDAQLIPSHRNARVLDASFAILSRERPWDLLRFGKVRQRSHLIESLPGLSYRYALTDGGASAYCDVSTPDALNSLSKEQLRNVDRLRRRAERDHGPVEKITVTDPAVATRAFDRFVAIESSGWKGVQGTRTGLAMDHRGHAFLRDVLRRFQTDGAARLDFLTIAGRDAAAQLAIRAGRTWFLLKIGYHPDFEAVGPGSILLKAFLEEMRDATEVHEVNLTTNPNWAIRWRFRTEPVYNVLIYGRTWGGRTLAAGRIGKELLKSIRGRLGR